MRYRTRNARALRCKPDGWLPSWDSLTRLLQTLIVPEWRQSGQPADLSRACDMKVERMEVFFFVPCSRAYIIRSATGGLFSMSDFLLELEKRRSEVLAEISTLGDFRPGSISATSGRCGNPNCHCHKPHDPGHGPNLRLTYKVQGKTVTESFPTPVAQRK